MGEAQICGLFRVPLMLIQSGDKTPTYASAEQFFLNYSIVGVTPDCVNYEKVIWRDLLTIDERKKYYAKFSVDALLRGDFETRMKGYQTGINCEMLSPNDCREKEDMNPYEGGDEYRSRTSTIKESDKIPDKSNDSDADDEVTAAAMNRLINSESARINDMVDAKIHNLHTTLSSSISASEKDNPVINITVPQPVINITTPDIKVSAPDITVTTPPVNIQLSMEKGKIKKTISYKDIDGNDKEAEVVEEDIWWQTYSTHTDGKEY